VSDDIIVGGKDQAEHDEKVKTVLERLEGKGLTVNETKCEFSKSEIDFFGLRFSANGISIQTSKLEAIQHADRPKTATEVRSFLGLASYCSRFIPDYSSIAKPLRDLTKKKQRWYWKEEQEDAFINIKKAILTTETAYFDKTWRTELTVDASPVGLGAVMAQYDPKKPYDKKIVCYLSRSLTDTEKKYSQVEKEGLAVVWACEKLHLYLYASEFDIVTDNKAIELIFGKSDSKPKARIERWMLRLLPYKFKMIHKPGKENIADFLSRNPTKTDNGTDDHEEIAEAYINFITNASIPTAISRKQLVEETLNDVEMNDVKRLILNKPTIGRLNQNFLQLRDQLTITEDGLILNGSRIIIPANLRKRIVEIAHSGHLGMEKVKGLLRLHVWFPKMDELVE
jgi:hypothetical protein